MLGRVTWSLQQMMLRSRQETAPVGMGARSWGGALVQGHRPPATRPYWELLSGGLTLGNDAAPWP